MIDLAAPIQMIDLTEARQLSKFVTVLVLVSAPYSDDGSAQSRLEGNNCFSESQIMSKLVEFFSKAMAPSKAGSAEVDFVFGDVTVSFSSMEAHRKGSPVMLWLWNSRP